MRCQRAAIFLIGLARGCVADRARGRTQVSYLGGWWQKGAATLPVVLILGGVILELTAVSSFVAYTVSRTGFSERVSLEALMAARSGAMDGIRKVIRNKDFSDADGYELTVGQRTVTVTVLKDVPSSGTTRVEATSTVFLRERTIRADLTVNATTGEVRLVSFEEIQA